MDWEVEISGTAIWDDRPAALTIHRLATGDRPALRVALPGVYMFTIETDLDGGNLQYGTDQVAGVFDGVLKRPAYRVEQIDVHAWHRLYSRRAAVWMYRILEELDVSGFRIDQRLPGDPDDAATWITGGSRAWWSNLVISIGQYQTTTISPTRGVNYGESVALDETKPFYFWIESQPTEPITGNYGITLDPLFAPVLIGDSGGS